MIYIMIYLAKYLKLKLSTKYVIECILAVVQTEKFSVVEVNSS